MGQETYPSSEKLKSVAYLDAFIERGIIFLLIFTPLVFGTVQEWSVSVMETVAFLIFGAWLFKAVLEGKFPISWSMPLSFMILLILVTAAQIVPLPEPILSVVSLSTANTYKAFMDSAGPRWFTISLYPDATREELFKVISYTVFFFVIINHYRTVEQIKGLVRVVAYMGCFLAIFAVVQKMTWNGRVYWFYPLEGGLVPMGPYINRNHFAAYMEMAIPMGLGLLLYESAKIRTISYLPLVKRIIRLLDNKKLLSLTALSLGIVIMAAAVFLCLSRGGITGFAVSTLFFTAMTRTIRGLRNRTWVLALLGIVLFFTVVVASWSRIEDRFGDKNIHRIDVWEDTVQIVRDFPVLGTGLGTFNNIYPRYQTRHPQLIFDHAHNDYIEALTDTGFLGFLIIAGMVITFFHTVIRRWRIRHNTFVKYIGIGGISSCVAMVVHSFTDFNIRIPANALLLTTIAAITYAAIYNVSSSKAK